MRKNLIFATAFLFLSGFSSAALACQGRNVVIDDKFEDDAGGWYMDESTRIANSSFIVSVEPDRFFAGLNPLYSMKDGDICLEIEWPDEARAQLGLIFWAQDYGNYYMISARNDGTVALFRRQNRKWLSISAFTPSSAVKTVRGETNILRVKVTGNQASTFVNDVKIRDLRIPSTPEDWKFGFYSETYDQARPIEVSFKRVKVTE